MKTPVTPFSVTDRVFDPAKAIESGQDDVLLVDDPAAGHAVASTLTNAASFRKKAEGGQAISVAFTCLTVVPR